MKAGSLCTRSEKSLLQSVPKPASVGRKMPFSSADNPTVEWSLRLYKSSSAPVSPNMSFQSLLGEVIQPGDSALDAS
ncbi:unnamed protein product [Caretta caretta]